MHILDKKIVLVLNKFWQAVNVTTPRAAFLQMSADASTGLDIGEDGSMIPIKWDHWINLPTRESDWTIGTVKSTIRVPVVIILSNFAKVPKKKVKFSRRAVFERDGGRDQYTGKFVPYEEGNLDHVNPRSKGGGRTWNNIVWTDKKTNAKKANRTPEEAGMKLIRIPVIPTLEIPVSETIFNISGIPEWDHFLRKGKKSTDIAKDLV